MTEPLSPQERWKCACEKWSSARDCITVRYTDERPGATIGWDERCECSCHDGEWHDYEDEE